METASPPAWGWREGGRKDWGGGGGGYGPWPGMGKGRVEGVRQWIRTFFKRGLF